MIEWIRDESILIGVSRFGRGSVLRRRFRLGSVGDAASGKRNRLVGSCNEIIGPTGQGDFGAKQGAKSAHTFRYVSDERRGCSPKAPWPRRGRPIFGPLLRCSALTYIQHARFSRLESGSNLGLPVEPIISLQDLRPGSAGRSKRVRLPGIEPGPQASEARMISFSPQAPKF